MSLAIIFLEFPSAQQKLLPQNLDVLNHRELCDKVFWSQTLDMLNQCELCDNIGKYFSFLHWICAVNFVKYRDSSFIGLVLYFPETVTCLHILHAFSSIIDWHVHLYMQWLLILGLHDKNNLVSLSLTNDIFNCLQSLMIDNQKHGGLFVKSVNIWDYNLILSLSRSTFNWFSEGFLPTLE